MIIIGLITATGGGAGLAQIITALRDDRTGEILRRVEALEKGSKEHGEDHEKMLRELDEMKTAKINENAKRAAREELARSFLKYSHDPSAKAALEAMGD